MKLEKISVSGKASDGTVVSATFDYHVPETLEEGISTYGAKIMYDLFRAQLSIAAQAPSRKELVTLWGNLPVETKMELIRVPKDNGVSTGTLPDAAATALNEFMATWIPGQRVPRTAAVHSGDPVKDIFDNWDKLTPERQEQYLADLQALIVAKSSSAQSAESADVEDDETEDLFASSTQSVDEEEVVAVSAPTPRSRRS